MRKQDPIAPPDIKSSETIDIPAPKQQFLENMHQQVLQEYARVACGKADKLEAIIDIVNGKLVSQLLQYHKVLEAELATAGIDHKRLLELQSSVEIELRLSRQIGRFAEFLQRMDIARQKRFGVPREPRP